MHLSLLKLSSFLIFSTYALGYHNHFSRSTTPASRLIHQFPNPTWIENLAVTSSNQVLVTDVTNPYLYLIDPSISESDPSSNSTVTLVHSFSPELSLLGITELYPSRFYLITRNFTLTSIASVASGVNTIYSVDLTAYNASNNTGAVVSKVAIVSSAGSLNGLTTLSSAQNLIIAADAIYGFIYSINVETSEYKILIDEPELKPPNSTSLAFGVNGLKVLACPDDADLVYIYFTNTGLTLFGRIPFSLGALEVTGPVEILSDQYGPDDFALDVDRNVAYIAYGGGASVLEIGLDGGEVTTLIGGLNETILSGPTSVGLGRAGEGLGWIYVSQSGKTNGVYTQGGKVLAVDIGDS
jgi:hypothetical protein